MSSLSVRAFYEPLRSIDTATLAGSYLPIGSALGHNCFLIKIVNNSDTDVLISTDGSTDQDICPAGSFLLYDETANASREGGLTIPKNTRFYAKSAAGVGFVYLVAQYAGA